MRWIPLVVLVLWGCGKGDETGGTGGDTPTGESTGAGTGAATGTGTGTGAATGTGTGTGSATGAGTGSGTGTGGAAGPLGWAVLDGGYYALDMPPFGDACGPFGDKYTVSTEGDGPDPGQFNKGYVTLHPGTPTPGVGTYNIVYDWVAGSATDTSLTFQDDQFAMWVAQDGAGTVDVIQASPLIFTWTDVSMTRDSDGAVALSSGQIECP